MSNLLKSKIYFLFILVLDVENSKVRYYSFYEKYNASNISIILIHQDWQNMICCLNTFSFNYKILDMF